MNFHSDQPIQLKAASMLDKKRPEYDGMLVCEICCEEYDQEKIQPVVLPCGHTFCSLCWKDFRKVCPNCREEFEESQVKKNYFIFNLMEAQKRLSIHGNGKNSEKCSTHRREIDRFCKSCRKLMCSVCHCEHLGSDLIISDVNLREEIEGIEKFLREIKTQRQAVKDMIDAGFKAKVEEIEKEETNSKERNEMNWKEKNQKIENKRKELIKEAEDSARQKIEAIEKERQQLIEEANKEAEIKTRNAEKSYNIMGENIVHNKMRFMQKVESQNQLLQNKIEISKALENLHTDTLDQCVVLFDLWESKKSQLQEIPQLYQSSGELLFSDNFIQQQNSDESSPQNRRYKELLAYRRSHKRSGEKELPEIIYRQQGCLQQ